MEENEKIICVDLDGTLIASDLTEISVKRYIDRDFWNVFKMLGWFLRGWQYVKYMVAKEIDIDVTTLPYNFKLLSYLTEKKSEGSQIFLATGSTAKYARQVSEYLQIFDDVFCSDETVNFVGKRKADGLSQKFGQGFAYAGNSIDDIPVWNKSCKKILVNPSKKVLDAFQLVQYTLFVETEG